VSFDFDRPNQIRQSVEVRSVLAALQTADERSMHAGSLAELFLSEATLHPQQLQREAEAADEAGCPSGRSRRRWPRSRVRQRKLIGEDGHGLAVDAD